MNDTMLKFYIATKNKIEALLSDDQGQDLVEYALLIALISVGVIATMGPLATAISKQFTAVTSQLNAV